MSWQGRGEEADFFDAKGILEGLFDYLGVGAEFESGSDRSLHPTRQASIMMGGVKIGAVGEVHPKVLEAFDISEKVFLLEINLSLLLPFAVKQKDYHPIPRFPAIFRDIALIIDAAVTHRQVSDVIKRHSLVSQVALF